MVNKMNALGAPRAAYAWTASAHEVDMTMPLAKPVPLRIAAAPQNITIEGNRTPTLGLTAVVQADDDANACRAGAETSGR